MEPRYWQVFGFQQAVRRIYGIQNDFSRSAKVGVIQLLLLPTVGSEGKYWKTLRAMVNHLMLFVCLSWQIQDLAENFLDTVRQYRLYRFPDMDDASDIQVSRDIATYAAQCGAQLDQRRLELVAKLRRNVVQKYSQHAEENTSQSTPSFYQPKRSSKKPRSKRMAARTSE